MGAGGVWDVSSIGDSLETDVVESLDDTVTTRSSAELVAEESEGDVVPSRSDIVSPADASADGSLEP